MTRIIACAVVAVGVAACNPAPPNVDLCKGRLAGDLVITEVMLDPDGADTGQEWVEVFNTLGTPFDMKGIQLYLKNVDGTGLKAHSIRAGTADARGYFTLGDVRSGPNPLYINYSYGNALGALGQTSGIIGVRCGTLVLDEMTYTKPAKTARSRMLDGTQTVDATTNDDEAKWCDAPTTVTYSGANAGTPGAANPPCPVEVTGATCLDDAGVRATVSPATGELVISEVLADPKAVADTAGEWVELFATRDVDVNGVTLVAGASKSTFSSTQCLHVSAGSYALVAKNGDATQNGGLPPALSTFTVSLSNSGGALSLVLSDAGVIDTATLPTAVSGTAWQLDPRKPSATDNDDPANFCRATQRWANDAGDFGTPGSANTACPLPPDPNSCIDTVTGSTRPIVVPLVGDVVVTEVMADPSAVADTAGEWFEVLFKSQADLNGLVLFNEGATTSSVSSQSCLSVAPMSYVVFAKSLDAAVNGGLPTPAATFSFSLANSGARFVGVKTAAGVELDRFGWSTSTPGASLQLDAGLTLASDNDVPTNICSTPAAFTYGVDAGVVDADAGVDAGLPTGDRGTPGLPNVPCQ